MGEHFKRNKKDYGIYIPSDVLSNFCLTPMAKILYGDILLLSRIKGYCFATNEFFANKYNCSHQSIRNYLMQLKSQNLIEVKIVQVGKNKSRRTIEIIGGLPPNYVVVVPQKNLLHNITRTNKQGGKYIPQKNFDQDERLKGN